MKKTLLVFLFMLSQIFYAQSDCISAISICGNSDISYTSSGIGNITEILNQNGGCLGTNERFSVWYNFTAATTELWLSPLLRTIQVMITILQCTDQRLMAVHHFKTAAMCLFLGKM